MPVGPKKWQTENMFPVTVKNILSYGLEKFVGPYVFILIQIN